jgi:hypothetical protein
LIRAVQQTVLGVQMKMDELRRHGGDPAADSSREGR